MIDVQMFDKKSGEVIGVASATVTIQKGRRTLEKCFINSTMTSKEPQTVSFNMPNNVTIETVRDMAKLMLEFADRVEEATKNI